LVVADVTPFSTLADEGFLSDEIEAVVRKVRDMYGPWLAELRSINALCVRSQYSLNVHPQSARECACAALYMRTLTHCQASVLLIERGMDASARAMIRCAMEAQFHLGACAADATKALAFWNADEVDRRKKARYLQQVQSAALKDMHVQSTVRESLADSQSKIQELDAHEVNVREMARVSGLEDLYLTGYAWLCGAVHSSARDIEQHFELGERGEVRALVSEPALKDLNGLCLMVGETMVQVLRTVAGGFALEVGGAFDWITFKGEACVPKQGAG
jgi:Family of unknown function (DUF5677)